MSSKTEERKKQNRRQNSGMSETIERRGRGPNKIKFSDLPPERQAEIRANKSRAGKASADKLTPEERRIKASNAGKIGGKATADKMTAEQKSDRGRIGGKITAKKDQKSGYKNLANARFKSPQYIKHMDNFFDEIIQMPKNTSRSRSSSPTGQDKAEKRTRSPSPPKRPYTPLDF